MKRPDRLRAALVVHLFHEDVALELLRRIESLDAGLDVIATGPPPSAAVLATLERLPQAEFVETPNEGFDVAPFLAVLPMLAGRGYDLVCKLHTKKGNSGFGRQWRGALLDALIGSAETVADTIDAFSRTPDLIMAGAEGLYISAAANMTANAESVLRLAPAIFPGLVLPADWGFFAGTMFWTRLEHLEPFGRLPGEVATWAPGTGRDGGTAHAVERLFGLVPVAANGTVGLRPEGGGPLRLTREPGAPVEILEAVARLGRPSTEPDLDRAGRDLADAVNPLLHYLSAGVAAADPHPLFASEWYARRNELPHGASPLVHFLGRGAMAPDPSPLFRAAGYVQRRPWLRRRNENALLHHIRELDATDRADDIDAPVIRARPHSGSADAFSRAARRQQLREFLRGVETFSFALKMAASLEAVSEWGDVHFAAGLANALAAAGHDARVDYRENWDRRRDIPDVVICLRGPVRYEPRPESINVLWVISHPDQVSFEEMEQYDLVYVASDGFAQLLRHWVDVPVLSLLQATDARRFRPPVGQPARDGVFFAGNSRGQDRPVVRWALELGLPLEIHGFGWEGSVPPRVFRGERIANADLPARYATAVAVLADHWRAMVDFGFVSNRPFDVLAAGGVPVTDAFLAIAKVFGTGAIEVRSRNELPAAVALAAERSRAERDAFADLVRERHSFDARAATIVHDVGMIPDGPFPPAGSGRGPRVHLVYDPADFQADWMVARRLLGPLSTDEAGVGAMTAGSPATAVPSSSDIVIAIPGSRSTGPGWDAFAEAIGPVPLVIDAGALPAPTPDSLAPLFAAAAEVWWPATARPSSASRRGPHNVVVPDSVDPRLWRDYHRPPQWALSGPRLRCVVLAPDGLSARDAAILAGAFAAGPADLTIIEPSPALSGPWTSVAPPDGRSRYAAFARWFRAQQFQVGLCVGPPRDADLAFLDFSAAGLLSVAPPGWIATPETEARTLVVPVAADWSDLGAVLAGVAVAPSRHAGLAAASAEHVWTSRSAAAAGTIIGQLLAQRISASTP